KEVLACCKIYMLRTDELEDWTTKHSNDLFSPTMTVMLRAMGRWAKDACHWLNKNDDVIEGSLDMDAVTALERIVAFVRRACGTWRFKNARAEYERQAGSNFSSARKLILDCFARRSRLLVLRVDLYMRKGDSLWDLAKEGDRAAARFRRLLYEGKRFPKAMGWICKCEHGIDRGLHWHWMVILDGHEHSNAMGLTKQLGLLWQQIVGANRGSYFNCYVRRSHYKFNGLGLVHATNAHKLLGMRHAILYMTKRDCVLRTTTDKHQDFRRSKPRRKPVSTRGAPRKNEDGLDSYLMHPRVRDYLSFSEQKYKYIAETAASISTASLLLTSGFNALRRGVLDMYVFHNLGEVREREKKALAD
ncbi:inovirus-type Gp2 protein, partial [Stenotrophomonas sp. MH1]